jgi:hypothetical protein
MKIRMIKNKNKIFTNNNNNYMKDILDKMDK